MTYTFIACLLACVCVCLYVCLSIREWFGERDVKKVGEKVFFCFYDPAMMLLHVFLKFPLNRLLFSLSLSRRFMCFWLSEQREISVYLSEYVCKSVNIQHA